MIKTYYLKPTMTLNTLTTPSTWDKPGLRPHPNTPQHRAARAIADDLVPIPPASPDAIAITAPIPARSLPPRQPLPTPVLYPDKSSMKLGLDVHLEFIMAVVQRDHAAPQAPRKMTPDQLVLQVQKWIAEGLVVYAVEESCGFGFVLHRQLVAAGAQSFLITPIALNGQRKTDKLDARALCVRLSRWVDGNRDELAPIRIPTEAEQRSRETVRRRKFLSGEIRRLAQSRPWPGGRVLSPQTAPWVVGTTHLEAAGFGIGDLIEFDLGSDPVGDAEFIEWHNGFLSGLWLGSVGLEPWVSGNLLATEPTFCGLRFDQLGTRRAFLHAAARDLPLLDDGLVRPHRRDDDDRDQRTEDHRCQSTRDKTASISPLPLPQEACQSNPQNHRVCPNLIIHNLGERFVCFFPQV